MCDGMDGCDLLGPHGHKMLDLPPSLALYQTLTEPSDFGCLVLRPRVCEREAAIEALVAFLHGL